MTKPKKLTKTEIKQMILLQNRAMHNGQFYTETPQDAFNLTGITLQPIPVTPTEAILAERGARYGDFTDHARLAQQLQDCMRNHGIDNVHGINLHKPWSHLTPVAKQALTVIADKIARMINGDANYDDNWKDIIGYSQLALDRLPKS